ncbi:MAG: NAD(P)-dependent oxidoreductase [Anaerolineae bacterium]|nr:NAD(P)-dependent oxidoreductase [Anaerolineae bacterium]
MRVVVTGALGNVGRSAVEELLKQGHTVRCFDLKTRPNVRAARALARRAGRGGSVDVVWGDLRRPEDVAAAVAGQEAVIHLAFIIPKLSSTGFESEEHPDWAREINVGGTRNLLAAVEAQPRPPRFIFASSYHIYGRTHDRVPPLTADDPVNPIEHYAQHKVECEQMVRATQSEWAILRLAAAFPLAMKLDPGMFDIPMENRMEYVHTHDAGLAFANAVSCPDVCGKVLLIGGGPRCQYTYRQITTKVLEGIGVGLLPDRAFATIPFPTDWLDTEESQRLLHYQRLTLDDYVRDMRAALGWRRGLIRVFRPVARQLLLHQSRYYQEKKWEWLGAAIRAFRVSKKPVRL